MSPNDDNDQHRPNPWGKPQGSSDTNPDRNADRGGASSQGRGADIDLDAMLRKARSNFDQFIPGQPNGGAGKLAFLVLLAAVVLWLLSGLYFIQPNQNGVVLTFGKYTRTDEIPGPKWKIPWPVQTVNVVDVTTERRIQIGYAPDDQGFSQSQSSLVHQESLMLTGDENIVDINFVVLWRVGNAKDFLYSVRDPEDTIAMVAASAMREIIGQTNIQPALTDARTKIQSDARTLMQNLLDEYHTGVVINNVQLQKVDPPDAVVDAFNEVQRARQKKEELRNLAEAYSNDIIPKAKGEAVKMVQSAEAYKQKVISNATGEANRFNSIYASYKNAPDVTTERMYLETLEEVLQSANTIVLDNKNSNVLPYLPLNDLKKDAPK